MAKRNLDLLIVCVAATAGVLAQTLAPSAGLHLALGLPLLMIWPGYTLTAALFPRWQLGWAERAVFSLGLSLMAVILGSVILNWTPGGLTPAAWTTLGYGLTLAASLAALMRRRGRAVMVSTPKATIRPSHLALLGLAAVITVAAVSLSRAPVYPPDVQGYTLLWLTPETVEGTPRVRLNVQSAELAPHSYHVVLTASGVKIAEWPEVTLSPGETWETATFIIGVPIANSLVEARLYRSDQPGKVYRRVTWWGSE